MKIYRPARVRALGYLIGSLSWTAAIAAVTYGIMEFVPRLNGTAAARHAHDLPAQIAALALIGTFGALFVLDAALDLVFRPQRYSIGSTEIVLETGVFWRRTRTIPYVEITRVETSDGPLMRLFGLKDIRLQVPGEVTAVTLHGIAKAEELRKHILDRRDSLHEAVLEGEYSVAKTPQDMMFERLDRVLERIERHLPPVKG